MFMDIRQYEISSFIKPQGHRHSYRGTGTNIFGVYAQARLLNYHQRPRTICPIVYYNVVPVIPSNFGAAIIVRKLETFSPRRAGQGVSDLGA